MWRDIERNCEKFGIPFTKPSEFPRNGLLAARIAIAFDNENWAPVFTRLLFRANFADDKNISDKEVITSILKSLDLDAHTILQQATTRENKDKLRERTQLATEKGIFGAPTFVIGDEIFWGNDRLEDAFSWYEKHK
jgi:2-hydroxychromene-2-carboxylate isomerase